MVLGLRVDNQANLNAQFEFRLASTIGLAPGIDSSGPVSGLAPSPGSPNEVGISVRSRKLILNLKAIGSHPELLSDALSVGDDGPI